MKNYFVTFFFLIIIFLACKKQVEKERPEFIGSWRAPIFKGEYSAYLDINENSSATYTVNWDGDNKNIFKGTARANDNVLNIGRIHYFKIIEYPHHIDTALEKKYVYDEKTGTEKLANWQMVLKGIHPSWFIPSGTWTYYKADY